MYQTTVANNKGWSFKLMTAENRKRKDSTFPVCLVLNFCGQRKLVTLDISARPGQWSVDFERFITTASKAHPDALKCNAYLNSLAADLEETVSDFTKRKIPFTNMMIIECLFVERKTTKLKSYIQQFMEQLEKQERFGHARTFSELLYYLGRFDKSLDKKLFADINYDYVKKFVQHQLKNGRKKGGISVNVRSLRTILNSAIQDNVGSPETYPFSNRYGTMTGKKIFSVDKELKTKTRKRFIPKKYLLQFYNFDFKIPAHQRTQHLFFFSFFCGGINFVDMATLKNTDILNGYTKEGVEQKYFIYERDKTHESIEIALNKDIEKQIAFLKEHFLCMEGYLLPVVTVSNCGKVLYEHIIEKRKKFNKYLKKMAKIMEFPEGLEGLSTYFARHSFAMTLFNKTKSIDIVSAGLHHASTETTKIYLEGFGKDEIAEMTDGLLVS